MVMEVMAVQPTWSWAAVNCQAVTPDPKWVVNSAMVPDAHAVLVRGQEAATMPRNQEVARNSPTPAVSAVMEATAVPPMWFWEVDVRIDQTDQIALLHNPPPNRIPNQNQCQSQLQVQNQAQHHNQIRNPAQIPSQLQLQLQNPNQRQNATEASDQVANVQEARDQLENKEMILFDEYHTQDVVIKHSMQCILTFTRAKSLLKS